jgi:hypothetical protein
MKLIAALVFLPLIAMSQDVNRQRNMPAKQATALEPAPITSMLQIKRVYVEPLAGDSSAEAIRQLLIATLQQSRLFIVTDNPDRADALVRGAADDREYTDQFDSQEGINAHMNAGAFGSGSSSASRSGGGYGGLSVGENESHHIKERKHEALATIRLCNREGDVLWATTQESHGAKFRGASADVADKVARQLRLDFDQAARGVQKLGDQPSARPIARP